MNTVTLSTKFQVVIPKEVRDRIGIKAGSRLEVVSYGNRIELIPVVPVHKLRGFLKGVNTDIHRDKDRL